MRIIKEKGTEQDVKKAFEVLFEVRRELKPLFKFPKDKTESKKEEQKQKLFEYEKVLKAKRDLARSQKLRRRMSCFIASLGANCKCNGTRLCMRCTLRIRGSP